MSGLLESLTQKAQALAQASPLAGKIPGTTAPEPGADKARGGGNKTLESLHHQLRALGQQYSSSTTPLQKMITSGKGVSIDYDSASRDAQGQSKGLYLWGQAEAADLKDVTDRLAYINYVHGSLAGTLAGALNTARDPLKELRNAETALAPRRAARAGLQGQIARIEHAAERGAEARVVQLREQLVMAERADADAEQEIERLKRTAVRDGERAKWAALREYGEKIVLLAQAASLVTDALPSAPPTASAPYTGATKTASARAALQRALDNYRTGAIHLPAHQDSVDAASVASFGDTHGAELAALDTAAVSGAAAHPRVPLTPPEASPGTYAPPAGPPPVHPDAAAARAPGATPVATAPTGPTSPALDTSKLNQMPAPLPTSPEGSTTAAPASPAADASTPLAGMTPTLAETGVPVAAGAGGPGPASGSLADLRRERFGSTDAADAPAPTPGAYGESADDEKKRLQREERERLLAGAPGAATAPAYESADDEKKRLQREERERILAGGAGAGQQTQTQQQQQQQPPRQSTGGEDADLPPYQEPFGA